MKFVSLRTKRAHRQGKLDKPSRATHESFASQRPRLIEIHTYASFGNRFTTTFGSNTRMGRARWQISHV
jgi:hypothetical protein